jgi:diketogulonate reductase-like aldo/keto reductase
MQSAIKTFQIWETLEGLVPSEIVHLGLSNVTPTILARIYERARIKPQAVQNRFCAENGYDIEVRAFCEAHGCEYQAYGVVTRCEELLEIAETVSLAEMARTSRVATVYFLLMNSLNVSVLNGTSNEAHISADIRDVKLLHEWISREENVNAWSNLSRGFHDHVTAVGIQWLRKQHYST